MTLDRPPAHYVSPGCPMAGPWRPGKLHRHGSHAEAVARVGWYITERALGVVTGEVRAGKTVAIRAALANLDPSRHTTIYRGNPAVGAPGLYAGIVTGPGRSASLPRPHRSRRPRARLPPRNTHAAARGAGPGRGPSRTTPAGPSHWLNPRRPAVSPSSLS